MKRLSILVTLILLTGAAANAAEKLVYVDYTTGVHVVGLDGSPISIISLSYYYGVGALSNGNILVSGYSNGVVSEYRLDGTYIRDIGSGFNTPLATDYDSIGNIYVVEGQGNKVTRVAPDGTRTSMTTNTSGFTYSYPLMVAVQRTTGDIYICNGMQAPGYVSGCILKTSVSTWGTWTTFFTQGTDQLGGVGIDPGGNVWVSDYAVAKIFKLDSAGNIILTLNCPASSQPKGLAIDSAGNVYVACNSAQKIRKFFSAGGYSSSNYSDIVTQNGNVSFLAIVTEPIIAYDPTPLDGTAQVPLNQVLRWLPGAFAASHNIYLGTSFKDINDATPSTPDIYKGSQARNNSTYVPSTIMNTTYYWRIDEVNGANTWKGQIWKFTMSDFLGIEDFESYADNNQLQAEWINTNLTATLEKTMTHNNSKQSMKLDYNTSLSPYYSKVVYDLGTAENWTVNNLKMLTLYFHGNTNNTAEQLYVTLEDSTAHTATVIYGYPEDLVQSGLSPRWNEWNINLQDFASGGVNLTSVKKITIGIGDGTPGGSSGTIYIDDIRLYQQRCVEEYAMSLGDFNGDCKVDINDVLILVQDWLLKGEGDITAASPNSTGLVAHYTFDETSGSIAADSSGNGYNATVDTAGLNNAWDTQGKYAGCLNFSGDYNSGAIVLVPDNVFYSISNQLTISVWVNADTVYNGSNMTIFDSNGSDEGMRPEPKWEGTVALEANGEGAYWSKPEPQEYRGSWHHYALVKNADTGFERIYHDGELVAENRNVGIISAVIEDFIVGRSFTNDSRYGTDVYKGKLDDLRIYNYALTQAEVLNIAGLSQWHQQVLSDADAYQDASAEVINFKDFAALAKKWLRQPLWP